MAIVGTSPVLNRRFIYLHSWLCFSIVILVFFGVVMF